jgi:hypothetical protein
MKFKVKRTALDDPTARPYADAGPDPTPPRTPLDPGWTVEIDSLDALMAFVLQHGEVILGTDGTEAYLEIYDAYRESDPEGTERNDHTAAA